MDNLLINLIGMGNQGSTTGTTPLKESTEGESKQKDFLNILNSIMSGTDGQETLLKKIKDIQESGEIGLSYVMSSISNMLLSKVLAGVDNKNTEISGQKPGEITEGKAGQEGSLEKGVPRGTNDLSRLLEQMNFTALLGIQTDGESEKAQAASPDQTAEVSLKEGQVEIDQVMAFQKDMMRLLASLKSESEPTIVQSAAAINLQQRFLKEQHNVDSDAIRGLQNTPVTSALLTKEIVERNAIFLRAILEKGGQANREDSTKGSGENKGLDGLLKHGEARAHNMVNLSSLGEQEIEGDSGGRQGKEAQALILNAAKKYKEQLSGVNDFKTNTDHEITSVLPQKTSIEIHQGDTFRSNIFQVKDNNMTFEKGSFTSFVTDRIEKIIEQFSSRSSQMDMVVRLKLDDKETLLVGLRNEGQKVIVDVKASNDGLLNLLQAHKDDITKHLQDKNIFTSIFVQPDGEKNFQRQDKREQEKEDNRQEAGTSFANVLEATA